MNVAIAEGRPVNVAKQGACDEANRRLPIPKDSIAGDRDLVDLADLEAAHGDLPDSRDSSA